MEPESKYSKKSNLENLISLTPIFERQKVADGLLVVLKISKTQNSLNLICLRVFIFAKTCIHPKE